MSTLRTARTTRFRAGSEGARRRRTVADPESRIHDDHHESLRLWLRLLTCTMLIERRIRARLREDFATTLPRFDLMAQLERNPAGLKMGELSRRLMVTGGNVTRSPTSSSPRVWSSGGRSRDDRRAYAVRLTAKGKRAFDAMAVAHERWVIDLLAGSTPASASGSCAAGTGQATLPAGATAASDLRRSPRNDA